MKFKRSSRNVATTDKETHSKPKQKKSVSASVKTTFKPLTVTHDGYKRIVLENGLTIILSNVDTPIVKVGFAVKAGYRNDEEGKSGTGHYLEHMLFRSTDRVKPGENYDYDALNMNDKLIDAGIVANASTYSTFTMYDLICVKHDEVMIAQAVKLLLEMYIDTEIKLDEFSMEKGVILEEFNMRGTGQSDIYNYLCEHFFYGTSLDLSKQSSKNESDKSIHDITINDIITFRETYYQPSNTVFIVMGQFDFNIIESMLLKRLTPLKNNPSIQVPSNHDENELIASRFRDQDKFKYDVMGSNNNRVTPILLFPVLEWDKYQYESKLIAAMVRINLYKHLRDLQGVTYSPSTGSDIIEDHFPIIMMRATVSAIHLTYALRMMALIIRHLKTTLISDRGLDNVKRFVTNLFYNSDHFSHYIFTGLFDKNKDYIVDEVVARIRNVTPQNVLDAAKSIFNPNKMNVLITGDVQAFSNTYGSKMITYLAPIFED